MIKPFKDKDYFKLIEQMNMFEKDNRVFATNIFQPNPFSEYWYGASFYNPLTKITEEPKLPNEEKLATEKQLWRLDKLSQQLGFQVPEKLTSREASALIDKYSKGFM